MESLFKQSQLEQFKTEILSNGFLEFHTLSLNERRNISNSGNILIWKNRVFGESLRDCSFLYLSPIIIFRPKSVQQLQKIVITAEKYSLPITFAGGKTGLSGGYANPYILVDLDHLKTLENQVSINLEQKTVVADQAILVAHLMVLIQRQSNNKYLFPIQPSSAFKLPVRVGGIISTNASGVTSGKLGATDAWLDWIQIMTPTGQILRINQNDSLFSKIIGGEGRYGVVLNAQFRIVENPTEIDYQIIYGSDVQGAFRGMQEIQNQKIFPLTNEFVMSEENLPGIFTTLSSKDPVTWAILLKGNHKIIENFQIIMQQNTSVSINNLTPGKFKEFLEARTAIAIQTLSGKESVEYVKFPGFEDVLVEPKDALDAFQQINRTVAKYGFNPVIIGYGHVNFRQGKGILLHVRLPVPVNQLYSNRTQNLERIANTIIDVNLLLRNRHQISPKAEHSPGIFRPWFQADRIAQWRQEIIEKQAFYSSHLELFDHFCQEHIGNVSEIDNRSHDKECLVRLLMMYLNNQIHL